MKSEKIEKLRKRYHDEWLIIAVTKEDAATTTSLEGWVLAHSPNQDEIYKKLHSLKTRRKLFMTHSNPGLPKGFVAAFLREGVGASVPV